MIIKSMQTTIGNSIATTTIIYDSNGKPVGGRIVCVKH